MKKFGFTLSELVVTLSIIGVVTVLLIPSIVKMLPDDNKLKVINAHSRIVSYTEELLENDGIYNCDAGSSLVGLACNGKPFSPEFNDTKYSGASKYEQLLAKKLGLKTNKNNGTLTWLETNGTTWGFETFGTGNDQYFVITIDTNGENGDNNYYGASNTTKPDRFRFRVNNYGGVIGYDAMTEAYLRNAMKSNSKSKDEALAAKLAAKKKYDK